MLQEFSDAWLAWMTTMGWQIVVLIVAAWALTRLLWRSSATLRYSLWLVVFIKLLLPPSFAAPWSAGTLLHHVVQYDMVLVSGGQESSPSGSGSVLLNGGQESPPSGSAGMSSGMSLELFGDDEKIAQVLLSGWFFGWGKSIFSYAAAIPAICSQCVA